LEDPRGVLGSVVLFVDERDPVVERVLVVVVVVVRDLLFD
jgi:hypothetical protein